MSWIWLIVALLLGMLLGYYLKDNASKEDIKTDVDISFKKNRLFNKRFLRRREKVNKNSTV